MTPEQISQIPEEVLSMLVDFVVWNSQVWEAGNEDDEYAASRRLDEFLAEYNPNQ